MKGKPRAGRRADAERNRRRVLEVAQAVFAAEGLSVRVEEIARRAGIGVGTVYRHFATKEALFEAIVIDRLERATVEAEALADARDPGAAFLALIQRLVSDGNAKRDFVEALGGSIATTAESERMKARFRRALGALLSKAQKAGDVRADVTAADVLSLVRGILADADATPRARARRLDVLWNGLRRQR